MNENIKKLKFKQRVLCSMTAGAFTVCLTTPIEVVKVHMQMKPIHKKKINLTYLKDLVCYPFKLLYKVGSEMGIRALWSGLGLSLVTTIPCSIMYLSLYEVAIQKFQNFKLIKDHKSLFYISPFICGSLVRIFESPVLTPLEVVRIRQQAYFNPSIFETYRYCLKEAKSKGYKIFYKGFFSTLMRDMCWGGLYWQTYTLTSRYLNKRNDIKKMKKNSTKNNYKLIAFTCGGLAGTVGTIFVTPFDMVKTVQQINRDEAVNFKTVVKVMVKKDGIMSLFRGTGPRLFKVFPTCAISITVYEIGKNYFYKNKK